MKKPRRLVYSSRRLAKASCDVAECRRSKRNCAEPRARSPIKSGGAEGSGGAQRGAAGRSRPRRAFCTSRRGVENARAHFPPLFIGPNRRRVSPAPTPNYKKARKAPAGVGLEKSGGGASCPQKRVSTSTSLGFIILRHVISELTAKYWVLCYDSIRRVYPDVPILIIDDNSDPAYLSAHATTNATLIQSEYPKRGDLLPYLYYLTHKISERVIILSDSAFITRKVPFCEERPYQHLWDFEHDWDQEQDEASMVGALDTDGSLRALHAEKARWKGCSGKKEINQ